MKPLLALLVVSGLLIVSAVYSEDMPGPKPNLNKESAMLGSDFLTKFKVAPHKKGGTHSCVVCHTKQAEDFNLSIHSKAGMHCSDCHGGDSNKPGLDAMAGIKIGGQTIGTPNGFIGKPKRKDIPVLCGRCHSDPVFMRKFNPKIPVDQLQKYLTSTHGQQMAKGKTVVATCSDCHSAHRTLSPKEPTSLVYAVNVPKTCAKCHNDKALMKKYGSTKEVQAATQYEEYVNSVHGKLLLEKQDTSLPACNDCHGNHGAVPPEVANVSMSCKQCHPQNAKLFLSSPHSKEFEKRNLPQCATCHTKHSVFRPTHAFVDLDLVKAEMSKSSKNTNISQKNLCGQCHHNRDLNKLINKADLMVPHFKKNPKVKAARTIADLNEPFKKQLDIETNLCFRCHSEQKNKISYQKVKKMKANLTLLMMNSSKAEANLKNAQHKGIEVSKNMLELAELKRAQTRLRVIHHKASVTDYIPGSIPENKFKTQVLDKLQSAESVAFANTVFQIDKDKQYLLKKDLSKDDKKKVATLLLSVKYPFIWNEELVASQEVLKSSAKSLEEFSGRRNWVGLATLVITLLVLVLIFKIRALEKSQRSEGSS
ncbi:MAG: cytochrome c3 family protein [Spirochaetota bacterium]|nr:cytochrome c3 family protein [Spirochaetota bacterium]